MDRDDFTRIATMMNDMLDVLGEQGCFRSLAEVNKKYFDELIRAGFTSEQAIDIVINSKPLEGMKAN